MSAPSAPTLSTAASEYINAQKGDRTLTEQALRQFVHWYGGNKPVGQILATEIDSYVEEVERSPNVQLQDRLTELRKFFTFLHKKKLTAGNLALSVRVRKRRTVGAAAANAPTDNPAIQLTREGHEQMRAELDTLVAQRYDMAEELRLAAADKDFRENAPYHAARERQGKLEARIRDLEATLRVAEVMDDHKAGGNYRRVGLGSTVVLRDLSDDEDVTYTLVSASEANLRQGKISAASPTGQAMLDREEGDEIEVSAPAGVLRYRIQQIS